MPRYTYLLLSITVIQSLACTLLQRGVYFFTDELLGFTRAQNLWLALLYGILYIIGAQISHGLAHRFGEKRVAVAAMVLILLLHTLLSVTQPAVLLVISQPMIGLLSGLVWPLVESYISAGQTSRRALKAIGRFSIAWAVAVPLGLAASGLLIATPWPWTLFALAAACNIAVLMMLKPIASRPTHLEADHPDRPDHVQMQRYTALLYSSRWTLLASYCMLFLLAPLMPQIFHDHGLDVKWAAAASSLLDVTRLIMFGVLGFWLAWHGRAWPAVIVVLLMPLSFVVILLGPTLGVALAGEVVFGLCMGMNYYQALYYAMVVKNASVDAGGDHEGLIGAGFAIGPIIGLFALWLADVTGRQTAAAEITGLFIGITPLLLLCLIGGLWPLRVLVHLPRADAKAIDKLDRDLL